MNKSDLQLAPARQPGTGLLLTGGGARAAYQVGVLQAISRMARSCQRNRQPSPFDVIVGTSAGAINATALACQADDFCLGVSHLTQVWRHFHAGQVYHASPMHAASASLRWLLVVLTYWFAPRFRVLQPRALLDSAPLRKLLLEHLQIDRLPAMFESGCLRALAVTTSSYNSGENVTFYDGSADIQDWTRRRRRAVRTHIKVDHLMASSAIPLLFPAAKIQTGAHVAYYGDGSMRQTAPISPVIHLGADRIMVIGVGQGLEPADDSIDPNPAYPSLAQVANHALSTIFLDTLAADAELLQRVNGTLQLMTPEQRQQSKLRSVDLLVLEPSQRLDQIAARHTDALPRSVRALMSMLGMRGGRASSRSSALASYMLFESSFTRELMRLGRHDALAQEDRIRRFFDWPAVDEVGHPEDAQATDRPTA